MDCVVSMVVKGKSDVVKGLTSTAKYLKTQTNLEISFKKEDRASLDFFGFLSEDIAALGLNGAGIGPVTFIVGEAASIGRLHNRSVKALERIMVDTEEIEWDADSGVLEYTIRDGVGADSPFLVDLIARLIFRSTTKCSHTRHSLTLFDLKQATGYVQDAKAGLDGMEDIMSWFNIREMTIKEEEKAAAAAIAAAKREVKKAETVAANEVKAKVAKKKEKVTKAKAKVAADPEPKSKMIEEAEETESPN